MYAIAILVGLISLTGSALGGDGQSLSIDYNFTLPQISESAQYSYVSIDGCRALHRIGEPALPFHTARVLLPPGHGIEQIELQLQEPTESLRLQQPVDFGRAPVPIGVNPSRAMALRVSDRPKAEIYESDKPYPEQQARLVSIQRWCGYDIAIVQIFPARYWPRSGRLTFSPGVRLHLELSARPVDTDGLAMLHARGNALPDSSFVDNPEVMDEYSSLGSHPAEAPQETLPFWGTSSRRPQFDYLLVTTESLLPAFQPLIDHKTAAGLSVTAETMQNIQAKYPGVDRAQKLRNFIRKAYVNWGIRYVLLGGDTSKVPTRGAYAHTIWWDGNSYTERYMPCDLYFACLDGPWNGDGDGLWGEPNDGEGGGDVDLLAEVYLGRAPVDTVAEVERFVGKTVNYEVNGHPHPATTCFLAEYFGQYGEYYPQGGVVFDTFLPHFSSYLIQWLDDRPVAAPTWGPGLCLDELNLSPHIVVHAGHCSPWYALRLTPSDLDSLTNSGLFLVYSIGCLAGAFGNNNDCMAERFINNNDSGAFATIMNSGYGFFEPSHPPMYSGEFQKAFFNRLLEGGSHRLGAAHQRAKHDMIGTVETSGNMTYRFCYFEINLFGDPHTPLTGPIHHPGLGSRP